MSATSTSTARKIGMVFLFKPDDFTPIGGVLTSSPWIELGLISERTIKTDNGEDVVYDDRDGSQIPVTTVQAKYEPSYDLTIQNSNAAAFQLYHRSVPAIAYTQSAGTNTDIPHKAWPSAPIQIVDVNGNPQTMVASITNLKIGSTVAVRGVDYDYNPGDLDRGFIYTLPTSTMFTQAALVSAGPLGIAATVTYALAAVTAGLEIQPLSGPCTAEGQGVVHAAACGGNFRLLDRGRYSVTFPEIGWPVDKVATIKAMVRKVSDFGSNYPRGRVIITRGQ